MKKNLKKTLLVCFSVGLFVFLPHGKTTGKSGIQQMEAHRHQHRSPSSVPEYPAFAVTATCAVRCNGQAAETVKSGKARFDPDDSPFGRVNGLLPPTVTSRLSIVADTLCINKAVEVCQGAEKISDLRPLELRSGSWTGELPFECSRGSKCVVSPFDARFISKLERVRISKPSILSASLAPGFPTADGAVRKRNPLAEKPGAVSDSCRHRIRARVCYGDCMSNDPSCKGEMESGYAITLTSSSYEGEESVEVCGDALLEKFKAENTPKALRPMACRRLYFEESQKAGGVHFSCGAVRFATPECDQY